MQLRPEHMRLIAKAINLNYEEDILAFTSTVPKMMLCDKNFGFKDGLHEPQKMLLIGFLYCKYKSVEDHMENLWHLINPNFRQKVSMRVIKNMLEDLLYVSID